MTGAQKSGGLYGVWSAFLRNEIAFPEAMKQACVAGVVAALDADQVDRINADCRDLDRRGGLLGAVYGYELLIVSLVAHEPSGWQAATLRRARISAMQEAKRSLTEVPDGTLYRWALDQGEKERNGATDDAAKGSMSFQCGVLNLDPYVAGRRLDSRDAFEESIRLWNLRFEQSAGDRFAGVANASSMPAPRDALAAAESWLRDAFPRQSGEDRGLSIKALLQTVQARRLLFDVALDGEEVDRLAGDALNLLDPKTQPIAFAAVLKMAQQMGCRVDPTGIERLLQPSLAVVAANLAAGEAHDLVIEAVQIVGKEDPRRALDLFVQARPFLRFGSERGSGDFRLLEVRTMCAAAPPAIAERLKAGTDTAGDCAWLDAQPAVDETAVACAYTMLASLSLGRCQEADGRACIARVGARFAAFALRHREALDFLDVKLLDGWAVDARDAGAYGDAVLRCGDAMALAVRTGFIAEAFDELAFLEQMAMRFRTAETFEAVARVLSGAGLLLQTGGEDRGLWAVVSLAQAVLSLVLGLEDAEISTIALLLQTVKGARFASELAAGLRYEATADPEAAAQLQRLAIVAEEAGGDLFGDTSIDIDEETLLAAYIGRFDGESGATAQERLANLQHRFDAHVQDALLSLEDAQPQSFAVEALRGCVDDDTVVLDLYANANANANGARTWVALVSTNTRTQVVRNPDAGTGPIGNLVGTLRRSIVQYTPVGLVDSDAEQQLAEDASTLFGAPLLAVLADLHAAGRRHLRIVPHGALNFYPLHLLGPPGAPLAGAWTISYLPNLQLARPLGPPVDAPSIAIGLSFESYPQFPKLSSSLAETTAVAQIFGTPAVVEGEATKARVFDALRHARYVHLSTHGKHNVVAPAFQCLYVSGDGSADRIFAYELLALDLRGLEVLTLSACETALGRFDRGDNLRGLPASLLHAGVHAIVGTLWPVAGPATATFFPAFYGALRPGVRVRDAFRAAQLACRAAYPKYVHWGAFYLIDRTAI